MDENCVLLDSKVKDGHPETVHFHDQLKVRTLPSFIVAITTGLSTIKTALAIHMRVTIIYWT